MPRRRPVGLRQQGRRDIGLGAGEEDQSARVGAEIAHEGIAPRAMTEQRGHRAIRAGFGDQRQRAGVKIRSEEHTSELQSLMRISYAVFCWKKKTIKPKLTSLQVSNKT